MSKNFEETVRLQSEKRREWIREIRGERLQGIAEGASSAYVLLAGQVFIDLKIKKIAFKNSKINFIDLTKF